MIRKRNSEWAEFLKYIIFDAEKNEFYLRDDAPESLKSEFAAMKNGESRLSFDEKNLRDV